MTTEACGYGSLLSQGQRRRCFGYGWHKGDRHISTCERRCQPQLHRRPGERRDPYAVALGLEDAVQRLLHNNDGLRLWIPAFAGTTAKMLLRRLASSMLARDFLEAGDQLV